ncbi:hypothetical protein ACTMU2_36820 [Cupriavidus basilensis]
MVENPEWSLMPDVQQPLVLTMIGIPIPVTVGLKHFGNDMASSACTGWTWIRPGRSRWADPASDLTRRS